MKTMIRLLALTVCMMADTGAGTGGGIPDTVQKDVGDQAAEATTAAPETIADTLAGAGDAQVENVSTTQDITAESTPPARGICPQCGPVKHAYCLCGMELLGETEPVKEVDTEPVTE